MFFHCYSEIVDAYLLRLLLFGVLFSIRSTLYTSCILFFQAEDGIRDLVRSRGLGDVYKRQNFETAINTVLAIPVIAYLAVSAALCVTHSDYVSPVSYTHLTLPTSDLV